MALKFKKPEIKQQRLKAMFYGEMGTGKSTCACQFPKTAYIDTEDTASKTLYAKAITENGGAVLATGDFDEILSQVKELMSTKHEYKTLVIDSLTIPYENLVIDCEKKYGSDFGRGVNEANKRMKILVNLLLRIDMGVIITCQSKREYGGAMAIIGTTYSCYNRLGYMMDLVFQTELRGDKFVAITKKSRLEEFPMKEVFEFNFEEVVKRMGIESIQKESIPEKLAEEKDIKEVKRLVDLLQIPEETYSKWLNKYNAEEFEEMPESAILKIIEHLKSKIQGE